jgi:hypothetical protein
MVLEPHAQGARGAGNVGRHDDPLLERYVRACETARRMRAEIPDHGTTRGSQGHLVEHPLNEDGAPGRAGRPPLRRGAAPPPRRLAQAPAGRRPAAVIAVMASTRPREGQGVLPTRGTVNPDQRARLSRRVLLSIKPNRCRAPPFLCKPFRMVADNANGAAPRRRPAPWHRKALLPVRLAGYLRSSPLSRPFVPRPKEAAWPRR